MAAWSWGWDGETPIRCSNTLPGPDKSQNIFRLPRMNHPRSNRQVITKSQIDPARSRGEDHTPGMKVLV